MAYKTAVKLDTTQEGIFIYEEYMKLGNIYIPAKEQDEYINNLLIHIWILNRKQIDFK